MCKYLSNVLLTAAFLALFGTTACADDYTMDPEHAGVNFKISHLGLSWIHGRFNAFTGDFIIDPTNPSKCSFNMMIKTESIDTNNKKRDGHLASPDFFNAKQFPAIVFKSTSVQAMGPDDGQARPKNAQAEPVKGYRVTGGDFTMHGVTKPVTLALVGGRTSEFPKGTQRIGFSADLILKRSEFGMDKFQEMIPDNVNISISFEGIKK